ncbi:MAG: hypothetical protein KH374_08110, partial [Dialister sp.]|nr:hypothetical protein [Dialister sp.]
MTTFVILFFIIKIVISKNFLFFTSAARFKGVDLPRRGRRVLAALWEGKGGADIFLDHSGSTYIIPKLSLYSTGLMPPKVIL